jgi:hypothetical protein
MFTFDMEARLAGRIAKPSIGSRLLQLLARRSRPSRIAHDHREMERFRIEHELRKAQVQIQSRFKIM